MKPLHEELKDIREERGITLEDIHRVTKIRMNFLEQIETGEIDFVPMPYLRAFLQEYAMEIGVDPARILDRLDNRIDTIRDPRPVTETGSSASAEPLIPYSSGPDAPTLHVATISGPGRMDDTEDIPSIPDSDVGQAMTGEEKEEGPDTPDGPPDEPDEPDSEDTDSVDEAGIETETTEISLWSSFFIESASFPEQFISLEPEVADEGPDDGQQSLFDPPASVETGPSPVETAPAREETSIGEDESGMSPIIQSSPELPAAVSDIDAPTARQDGLLTLDIPEPGPAGTIFFAAFFLLILAAAAVIFLLN